MAVAFVDRFLAERQVTVQGDVDRKLIDDERSLRELIEAKREIQVATLNRTHTDDDARRIRAELDRLMERHDDALASIRAQSPRYASVTQPVTSTVADVQRALDVDTLLLEFSLGEARSYAWALTSDGTTSLLLPPRRDVEAAARRLYRLVMHRNALKPGESQPQQRAARVEREYQAAAMRVSRILLEPFGPLLDRKRIVVVADGPLHYVPFAALRAVRHDRNAPLVVDHEVVRLPSASILPVLRQQRARARRPRRASR